MTTNADLCANGGSLGKPVRGGGAIFLPSLLARTLRTMAPATLKAWLLVLLSVGLVAGARVNYVPDPTWPAMPAGTARFTAVAVSRDTPSGDAEVWIESRELVLDDVPFTSRCPSVSPWMLVVYPNGSWCILSLV